MQRKVGVMYKSFPKREKPVRSAKAAEAFSNEGGEERDTRASLAHSKFLETMHDEEANDSWEDLLFIFADTSQVKSVNRLQTALYYAADQGCAAGVRTLLKDRRVDPSKDNFAVLRKCIQKGLQAEVKLLLNDSRVDVANLPFCPFEVAAEYRRVNVVKALLQNGGIDPSANASSALRIAAGHGYAEIVSLLLDVKGVDPSAQNNDAIRSAAIGGYTKTVKVLLTSPNVDPSVEDSEPLRRAAARGYTEIVQELLLDNRVDPCARTYEALRVAHEGGHAKIVDLILVDRRVRGSIDKQMANSKFVSAKQRRMLQKLKQLNQCMQEDRDTDFTKRFRRHVLRLALVGAVCKLQTANDGVCERNSARGAASKNGFYSSSNSTLRDNEREATEKDDMDLDKVFRRNVKRYLPIELQRVVRGVRASFQLYNELFEKVSLTERLQYLLEWKCNFEGSVPREIISAGYRPSAMKLPDVRSLPEAFLYVRNTQLEFIAEEIGKAFSAGVGSTENPHLSHADCTALFRVLMCIYSKGAQTLNCHKNMYDEVSVLLSKAILHKTNFPEKGRLVKTLKSLEKRSYSLMYSDACDLLSQ